MGQRCPMYIRSWCAVLCLYVLFIQWLFTFVLCPAPCTLFSAPCTLFSAPCTLYSAPCTLHPDMTAVVFRVYDVDRDGFISKDDLLMVRTYVGV